MSTTSSRPECARTRRSGRRRLTVAALCALACAGELPLILRTTLAQDPAPIQAAEADSKSASTKQESTDENAQKAKSEGKGRIVAPGLDALLQTKGTLNLREGSLADWMLAIQKTWVGLNVIYDNEALQRVQVTGNLTDTTLKEILDTILPANNFGYRRQGDALVILPLKEFGEGGDPNQKRALINMEYADPLEVEPTVRHLMSPNGKLHTIPSAKALMINDYPENIQAVREHIESLDLLSRRAAEKAQDEERRRQQPNAPSPVGPIIGPTLPGGSPDIQTVEQTISTVLWPKFVLAESIVEAIQSQIVDGTVTPVADMNALVVTGTESAVRSASLILKQLDVVQKQVRITVLMYDIRVDALEQLGINWRNAGKGRISANGIPRDLLDMNSSPMALGGSASTTTGSSSSSTSTSTGTTTGTTGTTTGTTGLSDFVTSAAPNITGSVLTLTHLSRHFDLSAVILALDQTDGARILARPTVTCYDRLESEIKIISEIPVQQLTQTDMGGNIGTTTFREAGVTLRVTPWIGDNGLVRLTLAPEFSVLTGFSQDGQPIIDRRLQTGTVMVQTGETLVLGGLRRRNELETVSGIPGLMNLKYVGLLFRSHRTTVEESELITFIRTEVIDSDYHGLLREQVAAQVAEETLDRVPIASHSPYMPPCNDPYCPIHNPRPKYWQGSMLAPDSYTPGHRAGAPPYIQPDYSDRSYPQTYSEQLDPPGNGLRRLAPETTPTPPVPRPDEPAAGENRTDPPYPPPVRIEENARRMMGSRLVLFRLPKVTPESSLQRLPEVQGADSDSFVERVANSPVDRMPPPPLPQSQTPPQRATAPSSGWQQLLR